MSDFSIRSDHVDVEQIMRQIRARIKEKRGVEYTEEEVRELASVKLEKFLNPRAVRSELVEHYRRQRSITPPPPDNFEFEDSTLYESHRLPLIAGVRRLLNPLLKLFFNPNPVILALHKQSRMNAYLVQRAITRDDLDTLNFEVLNNIVLELTRLSIEVKNLKMRIEAMSARQEFNERRARAFESVVEYKGAPETGEAGAGDEEDTGKADEGEARVRRRRRRRGRRRVQPEGPPSPAEPRVAGASQGPTDDDRRVAEPTAAGDNPDDRSPAPPPADSGTEQ